MALNRYMIERDIPEVGTLERQQLAEAAAKSNEVLSQLAPDIQWVESYVAADKTFCVYLARDEDIIRKHAEMSGFPASRVTAIGKDDRSDDGKGRLTGSTDLWPAARIARLPAPCTWRDEHGASGVKVTSARYSIFSLARNALGYHRNWPRAWRSPEPRPSYDIVIVGGGGHGLATAYYLANEHGLGNIAVLEKGWLGGGNTGRNTTIIRSNYLWDESAHLYEKSLQLYEGLSRELNFNIMLSQRGVLNLAHNEHDLKELSRRVRAIRLNGIDSEALDPAGVKAEVPIINTSPDVRYPILGASIQRRGGVARHDAVAWGFARAADAAGGGHRPELRGDRDRRRGWSGDGAGDDAGQDPPRRRLGWSPPVIRVSSQRWRASGCRSRATPFRQWCRSRSSRCSTAS